jgi:hypothetical protein
MRAVFWKTLTLASFPLTVVGIGISLLELSPAEFWGARICLIIAAIFLLGATFRWTMTSKFSKGVRTGVGIGALATISLALLLGLNWIGNRAAAQTSTPNPPTINNSPGNCNNYGLNSGTITNNCPTINEAPAPSIKLLTPAFSQEPRNDGTFANQILIRVTALTNLGVQVCGDGIKDLFASPYPAGMSSVTNINAPPGCLRRRFDNAQGTWAIVTTAKDNQFVVTPMLLP